VPVLGAAVLLAIALVASPLTLCVLVLAPLGIWRASLGLPEGERRFLIAVLSTALALRAALIAAQVVIAIPLLNDMSVGALAGDEAYYLSRSLRARDLILGFGSTKYDYFVASDAYGQTSYVTLLTWLQLIFGPTPFSMKLANAFLYVMGAAMLFRVARAAFGVLAGFAGLIALLLVPSLFVASVSLLKESLYFFATSVFVMCAWQALQALRAHRFGGAATWAVAGAVSLWLIDGLRRGGLVLMAGGLMIGLVLWFASRSRAQLAAVSAVVVAGLVLVTATPQTRARLMDGIEGAAKVHAGHVLTVGHVYKLMDDGFYKSPIPPVAWDLRLTEAQAARYLVRAAISFFVTPFPWQMRSTPELVFMPEHMLWYVLMAALPFGIVAGWRLNPMAMALFLGWTMMTAAVVGLTNGNIGTLLRMRGLVTPYAIWISVLGLCVIGERLAASRMTRPAAAGVPSL
jgi:hypothetical protein